MKLDAAVYYKKKEKIFNCTKKLKLNCDRFRNFPPVQDANRKFTDLVPQNVTSSSVLSVRQILNDHKSQNINNDNLNNFNHSINEFAKCEYEDSDMIKNNPISKPIFNNFSMYPYKIENNYVFNSLNDLYQFCTLTSLMNFNFLQNYNNYVYNQTNLNGEPECQINNNDITPNNLSQLKTNHTSNEGKKQDYSDINVSKFPL